MAVQNSSGHTAIVQQGALGADEYGAFKTLYEKRPEFGRGHRDLDRGGHRGGRRRAPRVTR